MTVHTKWVIFTHLTEIQMREYDISGVFDKVLKYVATSKSERKVFPLSSYIMFLLQKGEARKQQEYISFVPIYVGAPASFFDKRHAVHDYGREPQVPRFHQCRNNFKVTFL